MAEILVRRETQEGERRVAASPETVQAMLKKGLQVRVQQGAGQGAFWSDEDYRAAGATIVPANDASAVATADVVLAVNPPEPAFLQGFKEGAILVSFLWPLQNRDAVRALTARKASAFALDRVPRISRAQAMDALSSQSNIAGYKAVLLAADAMPRMMPLLMTAAGTITPARVVVLGAGVAGLQAIATARRLGAVVEVSDVRAAVKEQVQSLGARFIEVEGMGDLEGEGGYAREASPEFLERQKAEVRRRIVAADAVITTALVPGKRAPVLVTREMVEEMRPGSVIVDMAVEQGGNCELSQPGKTVEHHGVTIIGQRNLPSTLSRNASEVYARNLLEAVRLLVPKGELAVNLEDPIVAGALVVHRGEVRQPDVMAALEQGGNG
ncbi:MAG TPA: Re/Si-specific NAD(P)(+) transhydrogenase subunit alpha [Myxococcota bacterium]|nr:Re/Si-specific NAD(P)(+) transhydrogenase subunit alpha [Myxococcota bacterium]HQK50770.1 Re/Si-specific NAD(P)(+) transhydrogenase subunit alpha [Myxococcota bacterium]